MKYFKAAIDLAMMVMIVLLMAYALTGNTVHEYTGVALFVLALIHIVLNRAWYRALPKMLPKMKGKPKQQARILCNLILTAGSIVCVVTSVVISVDAFAFLNIPYLGDAWALVHTVSAFTMLVAGAIHFGFHGAFFKSLVKKKGAVHPRRSKPANGSWVRQPIMVILSVLIVVFGVGMYESKLFLAAAAVREQSAASASTAVSAASDSPMSATPQASSGDASSSVAGTAESSAAAEMDCSQATSSEQAAPADEAEEQGDPLDGQICTLCKKCCPLTAPLCDRGIQLAQQILAEQS